MKRLGVVVAGVLTASACGGPTGPSKAQTIVFLGSTPPPGSTIDSLFEDPFAFHQTFVVTSDVDLSGAMLEVEFLDAGGTVCGYNFTEPQDLIAGRRTTIVNDFVAWGASGSTCTLPATTIAVRATLLTQTDVGGPLLVRKDYATAQFAARYTFRQYPPPPIGASAAPPKVESLSWKNESSGTGSDPPLEGDAVSGACGVRDPEGDALTVVIALAWAGAEPKTVSLAFPPGASSSRGGVRVDVTSGATAGTATVTCTATDSHGLSDRQTISIP